MANSNRTFSAGAGGNLISSLTYVWDSTGIVYNSNDASVIIGTGLFRPIEPADFGGGGGVGSSVSVTNTAPIPVSGVVVSTTSTSSSAPSNTVSGISNAGWGVVLPNNPARKAWFIENLSTGQMMIKLGSTIPTSGNLNQLLKGASSPYAGDGSSWSEYPAIWTGPVSVSGYGGAPIVWNVYEL